MPTPVRVCLAASTDLVRCGLEVLLEPYSERVELRPWTVGGLADVELVDVGRDHGADVGPPAPGRSRLVLVWDDSHRTAYRAERLGATLVLPVGAPVVELVVALEGLRRHARQPVPAAARVRGEDTGLLTERETQVVSRICDGRSNTEIAAELYLSIDTVKSHVRTAYRKMGVVSRSQAVVWGVERGY